LPGIQVQRGVHLQRQANFESIFSDDPQDVLGLQKSWCRTFPVRHTIPNVEGAQQLSVESPFFGFKGINLRSDFSSDQSASILSNPNIGIGPSL
jgi:hypothetical protein